jgi:hypothetical protein
MTNTNRYDPTRPEHQAQCQRTACAERPAHPGGRHLDQRDDLYDGPDTLLAATSMYIRPSARKIISDAPELTPEVVDLVTYVEFLREQVAHVQVDKDRAVRREMARAGDCEAHGEEIKALELAAHSADEAHRRTDAARVALLGFLHTVDKLVEAHGKGELDDDLTVDRLVAALAKGSKTTHAAHTRAWSR